jgi:hypothetical protein
MDKQLTTEEQEYINQVKLMDDAHRYTKKSLIPLKKIKERITEQYDRECFCSMVRRKIWYKDFTEWHEGNS